MKRLGFLILMAGFCLASCGKKEEPAPTAAPASPNNSSGNPLTAPVDYLGAVSKAKKFAVKSVDIAGLTQAIQSFQAQEGRLPKDLNELVRPEYLPKLPAPPAGMKFSYNPSTGEVKVVPQ